MKKRTLVLGGMFIFLFLLLGIVINNYMLSCYSGYYKIGDNNDVDKALNNLSIEVSDNFILKYKQKGFNFTITIIDNETTSYTFSVREFGYNGVRIYDYLKNKNDWKYKFGVPFLVLLIIIDLILLVRSFFKPSDK